LQSKHQLTKSLLLIISLFKPRTGDDGIIPAFACASSLPAMILESEECDGITILDAVTWSFEGLTPKLSPEY
jgi:hypothetical protein